jgi:integrase
VHRFRDTAAIRWLRAGIDVGTVQSWLGHESLATTQKYLDAVAVLIAEQYTKLLRM